jgi:hypothetical protein
MINEEDAKVTYIEKWWSVEHSLAVMPIIRQITCLESRIHELREKLE